MSELSAQLADDIFRACQSAAAEIAEVFGRLFDAPCEIHFEEPTPFAPSQAATPDANAGLAVLLHVGSAAAVVLLADAGETLPAWFREPDATGRSKLDTLAQELGVLMLPETITATDFAAGYVAHGEEALKRGQPAADAMQFAVAVRRGEAAIAGRMVFPLLAAAELWSAEAAAVESPAPASEAAQPAIPDGAAEKPAAAIDIEEGIASLPRYARSLLKIRVPVKVTLAKAKQPVHNIVELGPGSLIQFDKSCDETLELEVANQPVAVGEAVKVGDKFGLRITSVILPGERFISLRVASGELVNRE